MKILITGITGKIGRYLAPELARDHEVYGIDILPSDWPNSTQADLCDARRAAAGLRGHGRGHPSGCRSPATRSRSDGMS